VFDVILHTVPVVGLHLQTTTYFFTATEIYSYRDLLFLKFIADDLDFLTLQLLVKEF